MRPTFPMSHVLVKWEEGSPSLTPQIAPFHHRMRDPTTHEQAHSFRVISLLHLSIQGSSVLRVFITLFMTLLDSNNCTKATNTLMLSLPNTNKIYGSGFPAGKRLSTSIYLGGKGVNQSGQIEAGIRRISIEKDLHCAKRQDKRKRERVTSQNVDKRRKERTK